MTAIRTHRAKLSQVQIDFAEGGAPGAGSTGSAWRISANRHSCRGKKAYAIAAIVSVGQQEQEGNPLATAP